MRSKEGQSRVRVEEKFEIRGFRRFFIAAGGLSGALFAALATTVFGLAPLVFFPGAGSELYRGLGAVVLGGLLVLTLFTLNFFHWAC